MALFPLCFFCARINAFAWHFFRVLAVVFGAVVSVYGQSATDSNGVATADSLLVGTDSLKTTQQPIDTAAQRQAWRDQLAYWVTDSANAYVNAKKAVPYYQSWLNPWMVYQPRLQQYVDVLRPEGLAVAHALALPMRPGNPPFEQALVYFPGPTCLYLDGRFVAYLQNQSLDLNRLRPFFRNSAAFYFQPSYQDLARTGKTTQVGSVFGKDRAPNRQPRDEMLAGSFMLMLTLLLGTRTRAFYRIFSWQTLLLRPAKALPGFGPEPVGWQSLIHLALAALGGAMFMYVYHFGQDPTLLVAGYGIGWRHLGAFGQLLVRSVLVLVALEVYVYTVGLALFNLRPEGSHIRGNMELFSIGACALGLWALVWNFTGIAAFDTFRQSCFYFCLILFCIKGFLMYKILVLDPGFQKFYGLSYICLTELLPSVLLIQVLTDL